jgi:hypothetical protein
MDGAPDGPRFHGTFTATYHLDPDGHDDPVLGTNEFVQVGLGFTSFRHRIVLGEMELRQRGHAWLTPLDDERVEAKFTVQTERFESIELTELLDEMVCSRVFGAIDEDAVIWEQMRYQPSGPTDGGDRDRGAVLTAIDRPIVEFRRWARQFDPSR